jgi:hypothetical protein
MKHSPDTRTAMEQLKRGDAKLSKEAREFRASRAHLQGGDPDAAKERGAQLVGPWFSSLDGAHYLRQPTRNAFWIWAQRHNVVPIRRAGLVLYAKRDIDLVLGAMGRGRSAAGRYSGPVVVHGGSRGESDAIEALRREVAALREEVSSLRAAFVASQ